MTMARQCILAVGRWESTLTIWNYVESEKKSMLKTENQNKPR